MTNEQRFLALKDEIPPHFPVPPEFSFRTTCAQGSLIRLSGHGPNRRVAPPDFDYKGLLGRDLNTRDGCSAARLVGLNLLVSLRALLSSLDRVHSCIELRMAVACVPSFLEHSLVANGCSDLLVEVFGELGRPTRMVVGAASLPFGMSVEASLIVALNESNDCKLTNQ